MVSLGNESRRQGGYFFDAHDGNAPPDTDDLLTESHVTLGADDEPGFRRIKTVWVISLLLLFTVSIEVSVFVLPAICVYNGTRSSTNHCPTNPYSVIIYSHAALWFILMLADRYFRYQHYLSRTDGYLDFYRKTRNIRRMPLMFFSAGMAILTVVMTLLTDHCHTDPGEACHGVRLSRINYLQILMSLEMAIIIPILITYLVWTVRFNQRRASPDVHQDELLSSTFLRTPPQADVGFRDEDYLDEVLEKQADLIRYLKQHAANLGRKILKLTAELGDYKQQQQQQQQQQ